ncbi:MAG: hypothetical protein NW217_03265 [Hyphomicrobiaceae bacterium]|nr:hypothetical protein [Hyphomicrobiaceae bacterium]
MKRTMIATGLLVALMGLATPSQAEADADRLACGNSVRKDSVDACGRLIGRANLSKTERFMALFNRGWAHRRAGANELALADFNTAETVDREFARLYLSRAQVKRETGDIAGAGTDLSRYIALMPNDWSGYHQRALNERSRGRHANALDDIAKALKLNPFAKDLPPLQVLTLVDLNRLATAKTVADRILAGRSSDAGTRYARAVVLVRQRDLAAADADLDAALAAEPLFSAAHALKGEIAEARGDQQAARAAYTMASRTGGPSLEESAAHKRAEARIASLDAGPPVKVAAKTPVRPAVVAKAETSAATKISAKGDCRRYIPGAAITIAVPCGQ